MIKLAYTVYKRKDITMLERFDLLFKKIEIDPYFRNNFKTSRSIKDAFKMAQPYLDQVDFDEFEEIISKITDHFTSKSKNIYRLDEAELESIIGGMGFKEIKDYFGSTHRISPLALTSLLSANLYINKKNKENQIRQSNLMF